MSGSYVHANTFLMRFPRPVLASLMRVTRFVSGSVVAVLLVMTFLEVRCPPTISDVDDVDDVDLPLVLRGGGAFRHDLLRGDVPTHDLRRG